jgi:hypothetical protein
MTDQLALECLSTVIIFVTAIIIWIQVKEMRRTTQAQAYGVAREILQDENVRRARKRVFELRSVKIDDWSDADKEQAGIVCHTYDSVGQMVKYNLLRKDIIIDSWGPSIRGIWPIVLPLVEDYREKWGAKEYWDDFEWLFTEAEKTEAAKKAKEEE